MTLIEWVKTLWPIGLVLGAFGIRMEVGQALNRQRLKTIEKDVAREREDRRGGIEGIHSRTKRLEDHLGSSLAEIRADIKTLLSRP